MINSRFIELYQTLDKTELRQLKLWVNSPIHNQHQDVIKLFYFLASRQSITSTTVQKKRAFAYLFPAQEYKEEKLSIVMNYALNILKDFFGYNQLVLGDFELKKNTIQRLKQRNMTHLAQLELQKTQEILTKQSLQNAEKSLHSYLLEQEQFELTGTQQRSVQTNLPVLFQHLTDFYNISMLKYACIALTHSNISKQVYEIAMLPDLLKHAEKSSHLIVQLYYNAYQCLAEAKETKYFYKTEELFLAQNTQLNTNEQRDMLLILINYCIKRLNTGTNEYRRKAFDWYKWGLETKVLIIDNELSRFAFLNIASVGLKLEEFDWVESFINMYVIYVSQQYRDNYTHYANAKLYFSKKNYDKAQRLLIQVEYDDIFLNLDAKTMLLEIYYEEQSYNALDALLVSFSRYLQRKSVIAYHKQVYQNIILLTRKLMNIVASDKAAKMTLKQEIIDTTPLAERDWLLEQVDKLR